MNSVFNRCVRWFAIALVLGAFTIAPDRAVYAQFVGSPGDRPTASPGEILQDSTQEIPATDSQKRVPRLPKKQDDDLIEDETGQDDQDVGSSPRYLIKTIDIEGITVLDPQTVAETVEQYENRKLTFQDIQQLARELTALYRADGFVTSRVIIPPQKIQNNRIFLKAAEGKVGEIVYEKNEYFSPMAVVPRVAVRHKGLLNLKSLSGDLRRINQNPDLKVKAVLKRGSEPHETDIHLIAKDQYRFHITPFWDNIKRANLGDHRYGVRVENNNVLGFGDRSQTFVSLTKRSVGLVNHYEVPFGTKGTKLAFDYNHSQFKLGNDFSRLKIKGRATVYSGTITQSLINEPNVKSNLDLAFDYKDIKTTILKTKFSEDKLRILRTGLNAEVNDNWGRTFLRNEVAVGIGMLNGTSGKEVTASRFKAGSRFLKYTASITRLNKLPFKSYGIFRVIGQWTPSRLVSAEQFQAGGTYSVRGYKEGTNVGDKGLFASAEVRSPFVLFPKSWKIPFTQYKLRENMQIVTFVDFAGTYINRATPGVEASEYLLSVGVGARARISKHLNGRIDVGIPLFRSLPDKQRPRMHFGVEAPLF